MYQKVYIIYDGFRISLIAPLSITLRPNSVICYPGRRPAASWNLAYHALSSSLAASLQVCDMSAISLGPVCDQDSVMEIGFYGSKLWPCVLRISLGPVIGHFKRTTVRFLQLQRITTVRITTESVKAKFHYASG